VVVGDERRRVAAGEAVLWPANVNHAAWTDHGEMRAIVVEFEGADDAAALAVLEGAARRLGRGQAGTVPRGEGRLAPHATPRDDLDRTAGEPL
jgi:hypothetical protein